MRGGHAVEVGGGGHAVKRGGHAVEGEDMRSKTKGMGEVIRSRARTFGREEGEDMPLRVEGM